MTVHHVMGCVAAAIPDQHGVVKPPMAFRKMIDLSSAAAKASLGLQAGEVEFDQMALEEQIVHVLLVGQPVTRIALPIWIGEHSRFSEEPPEFHEDRADGILAEARLGGGLCDGIVASEMPEHLLEPLIADLGGVVERLLRPLRLCSFRRTLRHRFPH